MSNNLKMTNPWFIGGWVFAFILSLLPLLFLANEIPVERTAREQAAIESWDARAAALSHRMMEMSQPGFWARRYAMFLRKRLEDAARDPAIGFSLSDQLVRILPERPFRKIPRFRVWAVAFPNADPAGRAVICQGRGLQTGARFFIRSLLEEAAREVCRLPSQIATPLWQQRISSLFGYTTSAEFFSPEYRGRSFLAIYGKSYVQIVWDLILSRGRPIGAILVLMPVKPNQPSMALAATMANWKLNDFFPGLLTMPTDFGSARVRRILHPALRDPEAQKILADIQKRMVILPKNNGKFSEGIVRLPADLCDRSIAAGGWLFRLGALSPECGCLAVLFSRIPSSSGSWIARSLAIGIVFWLAAWIWFFACSFPSGHPPAFGVRVELSLWFLCLVAVPLLLGIVTEFQYLSERRGNLESGLRISMEKALKAVEDEGMGLLGKQEGICRNIFARPNLLEKLKKIQLFGEDPRPTIEALWKQFLFGGLSPRHLRVYGHRDWGLQGDDRATSSMGRDMASALTYVAWREDLLKFPDLERALPAPSSSQKILPYSFQDAEGQWRIVGRPGNASRIWLGQGRMLSLNMTLWEAGQAWYAIGLVWDQVRAHRQFLLRRIPELSLPAGFEVGAFKVRGIRCSPNGMQGDARYLAGLARRGVDGRYSGRLGNGDLEHLVLAYPSQSLNGFVLTARAPYEPHSASART